MAPNDNTRRPAAEVRPLADALTAWLAPFCERIQVGGSLRRGKADVKDIELIVLNPTPDYFTELDAALADGRIEKARLGATGTTRWGKLYRSLVYRGVTFELFCCDAMNAGYQLILRTGSAEANEYLVTQLKYRCRTWRLERGYCWAGEQKLSVPTETDFFALCGLPYIAPPDRTEALYRRLLGARDHAWGDVSAYRVEAQEGAVAPAQAGLFDDRSAPPVQEDASTRQARHAAEAAANAHSLPRSYYLLARRALAAGDVAKARAWVGKANEARRYWKGQSG